MTDPNKRILPALEASQLQERLRGILDQPDWRLRLTLVTGDLLFGDFLWRDAPIQGAVPVHVPRFWDPKIAEASGLGVALTPLEIIYNSEEGTVYGNSWTTTIPGVLLADAAQVGWDGQLLERGFKNIANPFAAIIARHNFAVARIHRLEIHAYMEAALPVAHVSEKGITFERSELLYADFSYFQRLAGVTLGLGGLGITAGIGLGIQSIVGAALRGRLSGKLVLPPEVERVEGFVEVASEVVTTELEGEEWLMFLFSPPFPDSRRRVPMLVRRGGICYPRELWAFIRSPVVVLGERRQIPLELHGERWAETLTARAIGYVGDS